MSMEIENDSMKAKLDMVGVAHTCPISSLVLSISRSIYNDTGFVGALGVHVKDYLRSEESGHWHVAIRIQRSRREVWRPAATSLGLLDSRDQ